MKLTSLKRTPKEKKEEAKATEAPCAIGSRDDYPYGLQVRLDEESLDKLAMKKLPAVGTVVMITARAKVTEVRESANERETRRGIELQLTEMALETKAKSTRELLEEAAKD